MITYILVTFGIFTLGYIAGYWQRGVNEKKKV